MKNYIINGNLEGNVYGCDDFIMGTFSALATSEHKHYSMEIYVGLNGLFSINTGSGWKKHRAVAVRPNQPHEFMGGNTLITLILIQPECRIMSELEEKLFNGNGHVELDDKILDSIIMDISLIYEDKHSGVNARRLFDNLMRSIFNVSDPFHALDPRVEEIIKFLKQTSDKKVSVYSLCSLVDLSESRIAHLFKEETGVSLHNYILWSMLKNAIRMAGLGKSLTDASHDSGFFDSAHMTRTWKKLLGFSPQEIVKSVKSIKTKIFFEENFY